MKFLLSWLICGIKTHGKCCLHFLGGMEEIFSWGPISSDAIYYRKKIIIVQINVLSNKLRELRCYHDVTISPHCLSFGCCVVALVYFIYGLAIRMFNKI
jgi:hypothetical protein